MKLPLTYPARYHALKKLKGSDGKMLWDSRPTPEAGLNSKGRPKGRTYVKKRDGDLPCA